LEGVEVEDVVEGMEDMEGEDAMAGEESIDCLAGDVTGISRLCGW
jgi:hypothetical protein